LNPDTVWLAGCWQSPLRAVMVAGTITQIRSKAKKNRSPGSLTIFIKVSIF
jgi:hypothetical protein